MKRNEHIVPLSRDHHYGLLFCWKIRQGIKLGIEPDRIKRYILYFWDHHLRQHFNEEETFLLVLKDDSNCRSTKEEHKQIEALINEIRNGVVSTELFNTLADQIDGHIRYEERELFPYLEQALTEQHLSSVGLQLSELHRDRIKDDYDDEFWVRAKK